MTPAQGLVRRLRELALMLELRPGPFVSREAMLTHVNEALRRFESECADAAAADDAEYAERRDEVAF